MPVTRRLTEGDGLQMLEDTVLQRLTLAVRRDVVAYLADLADGSRPDRGPGLMAFNPLIDYPAGTVGARIKAIVTGIGEGQPWADVAALLADLAGLVNDDVLSPELRDAVALVTADASVPGSVSARIAAEALARAEAFIDEVEARNLAIANAVGDTGSIDDAIALEVIARNDAIAIETQARIDAIELEAFNRGEAIGTEASARETLATQLRGAYAGTDLASVSSGLVYAERQARSTADASEVSTREALSAKLTGVSDPTSLTLNTLAGGLLFEEREARATGLAGEAFSRTTLATQLRGAYTGSDLGAVSAGLLYDERQARSTADASEVSARQSLSAKLTGVIDPTSLTLGTLASGLLYDEREARATAVSGEASSRTSLATQLRGAYGGSDLASVSAGLLYDERQARSTADASEVSARESLSAKLTGVSDPTSLTLGTLASGLLFEEREARATGLAGEASSRTTLATQLRGAYTGGDLGAVSSGLLYDERQARSTADASEVSARQSLSVSLTGVVDPSSLTLGTLSSGMLYDERQARVTAVSSEAGSRQALEVQLRGTYAGTSLAGVTSGLLADERDARAYADSVEVTARSTLAAQLRGAYTGDNVDLVASGLIYEERMARVSAIEAEALLRSNLTSSVMELVADVGLEAYTRASQVSGIHANYSLKVSATRGDGLKVFGMIGLNATAPTDGTGGQSQIIMSADSLAFVPASLPNASPAQFFELGLVDGVTTLRVPAARIGDLTVTTLKIGIDAVTVPRTAVNGATYYGSGGGAGTTQTIFSYAFTMPADGSVIVLWSAQQAYAGTVGFQLSIRLNGVEIGSSRGGAAAQDAPIAVGFGPIPAGSNTITVVWAAPNGISIFGQKLIILGAQR